jgi:hypothetical protein
MATVWILYASSNDGLGRRFISRIYDAKPLKADRVKTLRDLDEVGLNGSFESHKLIKVENVKSNTQRGVKKSRRRV